MSQASADEVMILFVAHPATLDRDANYWRSVASRLQELGVVVDVVGVCEKRGDCLSQAPGMPRIIDLLDPYQARIVARADSHKGALLYRGNRFIDILGYEGSVNSVAQVAAEALQ